MQDAAVWDMFFLDVKYGAVELPSPAKVRREKHLKESGKTYREVESIIEPVGSIIEL